MTSFYAHHKLRVGNASMRKGKRTLLSNALCQFLYLCVNWYSLKSKYKLIELKSLRNCIFSHKLKINY